MSLVEADASGTAEALNINHSYVMADMTELGLCVGLQRNSCIYM